MIAATTSPENVGGATDGGEGARAYGRRTMPFARIAALFAALAAAQAGLLVLGPVLPDVAAHFGVSAAAAGQLRTGSGFAGALAGLAAALLGPRRELAGLLRAGLLLVAAGSAGSAAAPSITVLAVAQAVVGAGAGLLVATGMAAAASWSVPGRRTRVVATVALGQPVAWIAGQPAAGALGALGWRWTLLAAPVLTALIALVLLRPPGREPGPEAGAAAAPRPARLRGWIAGELAAATAWAGILVFIATLLRARHGISPATAGAVLGACSLAYLPAGVLAGRLSAAARRAAVPALGAASATLAVALGVADGPLGLSAGLFAALVATAAGRQVASSIDGLGIAAHPLAAMGWRSTCVQTGYLAGAALGGLALGAAGPSGACLVAAAGFAASTGIALARHRPSRLGKKSGRPGVHPCCHPNAKEAPMPITPITIRPAMTADEAVVRDLASLDAQPALRGPVLLAESRGRPIAAIALDDGAVAADPFRRTSGAVTLLRLQRELVREQRRGARRHLSVVPRLRAA